MFPTGVLAGWPSSLRLKEAAFLTLGIQLVTAVIYSWWSEICSADPLERGTTQSFVGSNTLTGLLALVIGLSNGLQYAMNAWIPLLVFKQTDSPSFRKGFPATFACKYFSLIFVLKIADIPQSSSLP